MIEPNKESDREQENGRSLSEGIRTTMAGQPLNNLHFEAEAVQWEAKQYGNDRETCGKV
jgi:hypothetical protein